MKANAPKKIYLQVCGDCNDNDCKSCKFEDVEDNVTWCKDKIFEKDIEYVRKDAFIEKACEWIANHAHKYICDFKYKGVKLTSFDASITEDFKKYMEERL